MEIEASYINKNEEHSTSINKIKSEEIQYNDPIYDLLDYDEYMNINMNCLKTFFFSKIE